MAKTGRKERALYLEKTSAYRSAAETIIRDEQAIRHAIDTKPDPAIKRLELSQSMLNLASNYLVMNGIYLSMHDLKDESVLNEARKSLYRSVIYLEEVVSNYIDAPFSDYEKRLALIEPVSPAERYYLVQKMGLTISLLENAYGYNTKWKWSFVELEGRFSTVAKNLINLRDIPNSDPHSPHYEPTLYHARLVKKLLIQSADRYREKYEQSTNRIDDFRIGIMYLSALKRMYVLTGDHSDAATVQKKLDKWNNKLNADMIRQEEQLNKKG